jgi:hypothetical protein
MKVADRYMLSARQGSFAPASEAESVEFELAFAQSRLANNVPMPRELK